MDDKASRNASPSIEGGVLSVIQKGNRISIEPIEQKKGRLLAEVIVVDGRLYEKVLGKEKGTVQAAWGTDNQTLWLQTVIGGKGSPKGAMQRSVWRLQDFGNTWTRHTWTIQPGGNKESIVILRKRAPGKDPAPKGTPAPKAAPTPGH